LKSGNLEIPFITTDLDLDGERIVKEAKKKEKAQTKSADKSEEKASTSTPPKQAKQEVSSTTPEVKEESKVDKALSENDISGLVKVLKEESSSLKDLRKGLSHLIQNGNIEQAKDVIQHIDCKPNKIKKEVTNLIEKIAEVEGIDAATKFVDNIPEEKRRILNTNKILRDVRMSNPDGFIESIKSASLDDWLTISLPYKAIKDIFEKSADTRDKLDQLAVKGSVPASVVLGRFCCAESDAEGLVKYWSQDNRDDRKSVAKSFIIDVHTVDKLRWVASTLNYDTSVMTHATNMCLSNNKDKVKEILDFALQHGVSLDTVNTTALKKAAEIPEFSKQKEAATILEEREKTEK